ncbi:hypothetical protein SKTS_09220 [Sulfurimicrobium lacus]|uniref:DUF748 domain-containing protein n=1 Tax=Sulfurimicrobium lacus TaxID=2715678 RepID=A0A6F8VAK6_9PROT|nr:DUF748 domain-containing protein [Sulfurimicrobium lacus]BCB26036.1 hypothetical protein SKTS_09220 [Sulfurimicrobium lacus]
MRAGSFKRWVWGTVIFVAVLAGVGALGLHFAIQTLKGQIEHALGAESEVGDIQLGLSSIVIDKVRIRAPKDWPAEDTLRAQRIVVEPDLRGLLSANVRIYRITVEDGYLSILRPRTGHVRLLPSMLEKPEESSGSGSTPVSIGTVELKSAALDFYDASVRKKPHKLRLEQIDATLESLQLPDLQANTRLDLKGTIKGVRRDGTIAIDGWMQLASKNSEIASKLRGVDLLVLQPYLIKASETEVKRGTLDLDLNSIVKNQHLKAPGTLTLSHLELASIGGSMGTFMGMPRQAVVASLKDKNDRIVVNFTMDGDLGDPHFSLNESFSRHLGTSLAESMGVGIEGLAHGVGKAAQGVGGVIGKLFGK